MRALWRFPLILGLGAFALRAEVPGTKECSGALADFEALLVGSHAGESSRVEAALVLRFAREGLRLQRQDLVRPAGVRLRRWLDGSRGAVPVAERLDLEAAVQALAACSNWVSDPAVRRGWGTVRAEVFITPEGAPDSRQEAQIPAEGTMLFVGEVQVARTGRDGVAEFPYPAGSHVVQAMRFPYYASDATVAVASGEKTRVRMTLDSGKEIAAYSHPFIDELQDGVLPGGLDSFHVGFAFDEDGRIAVLDGFTSVTATDDRSSAQYDLTGDCAARDGRITVRITKKFAEFLAKAQGRVSLDVYAWTAEEWPHRDAIRFVYGGVLLPGAGLLKEAPDLPWDLRIGYHSRDGLTKYVRCDGSGCDVRGLPNGVVSIGVITAHAAFSMESVEISEEFPLRAVAERVAAQGRAESGPK
ncbi:hypothetical protein [Paludibaculum fermentans]|uniref:Uncharacterized protein n=1 Tax=Paludibaculum fermentans TaxID=1473598 RepID=A0A7S7SM42_PALFE|nr:hypothetical protein [Paludibaculum fermentans]QOY89513.1 hypothetical protein IRI77_06055 [Paludibaculum fermentans]